MPIKVGIYSGYVFNGTSDYIKVTRDAVLEPTTNITFECRIRLDAIATSQAQSFPFIIQKEKFSEGAGYATFIVKSTGFIYIRIWVNGVNYDVGFDINSWDTATFHHIAGVYDGSNVILYIDGVNVNQSAATGSINQLTTYDLNFGAFGVGSSAPIIGFFQGFIDEVRIWNSARSAADILANISGEVSGSSSGLIGYWKFNETSGAVATDSTANGNDGSITGTTRTNYNYQPTTYYRYEFDGSTSYIKVPRAANLEPTSAITVECRVQLNSTITNQPTSFPYLVNKEQFGSSAGYGIFFVKSTEDLIFRIFLSVTGIVDTAYDVSGWDINTIHHVSCVYNGSNCIIYVDGVNVAQSAAVSGTIVQLTTQDFNIGAFGVGSGNPSSNWLDGMIDDVRLWSTARSVFQIQTDRITEVNTAAPGLISYWKLNETSGTVATDATDANNGTLSGVTRNIINYRPDPDSITFSAVEPTEVGNRVTPTSSSINFVVNTPILVKGTVTITPTPVVILMDSSSIKTILIQLPDPALSSFIITAPILRLTQYATPNIITLALPPPTIVIGAVTVQANPAIATFSVPNTTIVVGAVTVLASPASAVFTANSIKANFVIYPSPTVINFVVGTPTIRLTQYATPGVITLALPPPTIVVGPVTIQANPALTAFSANGITANFVIHSTPSIAAFTLPTPRLRQTLHADPVAITFSSPTPSTFIIKIKINFGVTIFKEINYHVIIEKN